jgi:hypothetical protein
VIWISQGIGQNDKVNVGEALMTPQNGSFYNYSDKNKVNIEVNIWGFVKNPGKYLIPKGSSVQDLISYSGGPILESNLEDIRLFRPKNDSLEISEDKIINLNYNDLLWAEKVGTNKFVNPTLEPGDILVFPGGPRYFFRDNIALIASLTSVLVSVAILIVTITKK